MTLIKSTRPPDSTSTEEGENINRNDASVKVLVVDDEEVLREVIQGGFAFKGFESMSASGGTQALEMIKTGSFSHVITDLRMPAGDGVTLLREAKKLFPDLPILVITGFSDYSRADLMKMGAADVVEKPFKMSALLQFVRTP